MAVLLISAGQTVSIFALFAKVGGEKKRAVLGMQVERAVAGMFGQVCLVSCDGERRLDVHRELIFIPLSQCQHKRCAGAWQAAALRFLPPHDHTAWSHRLAPCQPPPTFIGMILSHSEGFLVIILAWVISARP